MKDVPREIDPVYRTEVGQALLRVSDLSECTLDPNHAVDIAEWLVDQRHPVRNRIDYLLHGGTRTQWQARAIREHFGRIRRAAQDRDVS